ncbi:hypothetical protein I2485_10165 [Nesterenkonia sp. E16_7]|uniref:hypothetical protein n=1 Tax=unclassified Nesterenkonia TaxID=2629769 RepID=UPI001A93A3C1|nr:MULTISPECIES: hypothetical protein [unclassified Nesterenkonia]MBO0595546.1 hypothetical protein [Nesterenkonia sp. E16_10]MBO0599008.1 hypothetical protein [Nesterenkonia sp. E16_7]
MARRGNLISGLLFLAPIGIVLSAIPQAPDYTAAIRWVLASVEIGAALVLALLRAKALGGRGARHVTLIDAE